MWGKQLNTRSDYHHIVEDHADHKAQEEGEEAMPFGFGSDSRSDHNNDDSNNDGTTMTTTTATAVAMVGVKTMRTIPRARTMTLRTMSPSTGAMQ